MEANREESRLHEVQDKIEALYLDRGDNFNLPARYQSLVKLEAILLQRVNQNQLVA